jgi:hypothetical protein
VSQGDQIDQNFSPYEMCLSSGNFMKIKQMDQIFRRFYHLKKYVVEFVKMLFGPNFG